MGKILRYIFIGSLLFFVTISHASQRPKVGLALSGGGARGLAHVGVLRALEEQNIPIDYIAGTSAGALVGAMYASGLPIDEIERRLKAIDFEKTIYAKEQREYHSQYKRDLEYKSNNAIEVGIKNDFGVTLPKGAINTLGIEEALRELLREYPSDVDFDTLPIPFRAVAGDLATGKSVILRSGILSQALRASMAIPAVFAPVELQGKLLTDGMISNNLPIDVVRQMGADVVIAVNVGTGMLPQEKIQNMVNVSEQLVNILVQNNVDERLKSLTKNDYYVVVDVGDIGNLQFSRIDEAINAGYIAMQHESMRHSIKKIASTKSQKRDKKSFISNQIIRDVTIVTNGKTKLKRFKRYIESKANTPFSLDVVNQDIKNITNSFEVESVHYAFKADNTLVYEIREKDIKNHLLRGGIEVASDDINSKAVTLYLSHRASQMNTRGGEWRNYLILGRTSKVITEFNQPLTQDWFIRATAQALFESDFAYLPEYSQAASEYKTRRQAMNILVGKPISNIGEWGVGASWNHSSLDSNYANPSLPIDADSYHRVTLDGRVTIDQLDNLYFPSSGYYLGLHGKVSPFGVEKEYMEGKLRGVYAHKVSSNGALVASLELAGSNNEKSLYLSPFKLGGYHRLSGYKHNQFIGNYLALGMLTYRHETPWRFLGNPFMVGSSFEFGNTWETDDLIDIQNLNYAGSLFGAIDTPLGPAQIGLGTTKQGDTNIYFYFGRVFDQLP